MRGARNGSLQRQPHAGDAVAHLVDARRVLELHQRQAAIVLIHAGMEYARDPEAAHARLDAGRRRIALGRDQHQLIAHGATASALASASPRMMR